MTTTTPIKLSYRSGSFLSKSATFDFTHEQTLKLAFVDEPIKIKSSHFTFSISFNPAHLSYDNEIKCVKNWTMYYYQQNKNKSWSKSWKYITCDQSTIDSIIGANNRIEIETQIHDELLSGLTDSLTALQNTFPQYYATPISALR